MVKKIHAFKVEKVCAISALSPKTVLGCEIAPSKKKAVCIEDFTVLNAVREKVRLFSSKSRDIQKVELRDHLIELGGLRSRFRNFPPNNNYDSFSDTLSEI